MMESYIRSRRPLSHFAEAIRRGAITVGFVGGSITEPEAGRRWSDKLVDWLIYRHPGLTVNVENAAKGATGSLSAIFRVEEDILNCGCDIVFVETAVNDGPPAFGACREGLLRKLLRQDRFDVVLVYTFCDGHYADLSEGRQPASVADWEELAEHYRISSVFSGAYALELLNRGFVRWEEWLPDGLHPQQAGSRLYVEPIAKLLEDNLNAQAESRNPLLEPLHPDHWEQAHALAWPSVERIGPWRLTHERRLPSVTYMLFTASLRAGLKCRFHGRGVILRRNVNGRAAGYRYRFDGGAWRASDDALPDWGVNASDWVREEVLATDLPDGEHELELYTTFAKGAKGSNFELAAIGVIR